MDQSPPRIPARERRAGTLAPEDPARLLLAERLTGDSVSAILRPYRLQDPKRADANIQAMAGEPRPRAALAAILRDLLDVVAETADPDQALTHWERFTQTAGNRTQLYQYLASTPRILHVLSMIFGNSPYLAQTLIRDPLLLYWLAEEQVLTQRPSPLDCEAALRQMLANVEAMELKMEALRRFKRREMLRIGVRDLLRLASVPDTTAALSELATVLIQAAYEIVTWDLQARHGAPLHRDRDGKWTETRFVVIGLGKLGGGELNFSSDVDLIYVYESEDGRTRPLKGHRGAVKCISSEEYFEYLARGITQTLNDQTQEGAVFRVDLRLRAEGRMGQLARSLAGYQQYYRTRGQGWERQALLKAWPIAGDRSLGFAFLRMVKPFIAGAPSQQVIAQIREIKAMIDEKMADRGHEHRNVKLGIGGIREIEFLVQAMQLLCGAEHRVVLERNTLAALTRLRAAGLLSAEHAQALMDAYLFLRDVEHKLQMVHDLQTHALPSSAEDLAKCAVRLGYPAEDRPGAAAKFLMDHRYHTSRVNALFKTFLETAGCSIPLKASPKRTRTGRIRRGASPNSKRPEG